MGSLRVEPKQNHNEHSTAYGKWYFKAYYNQTLDVTELAAHIAKDSKVERSKVSMITNAIVKQMGELLCNGHPIRVPHLGILKLGVSSEGTDTVTEFNARTAIKDLHVMLVPDKEIKKALREMKFTKFIPKDSIRPEGDGTGTNTGTNTGGDTGGGTQGDSTGGNSGGGGNGGNDGGDDDENT